MSKTQNLQCFPFNTYLEEEQSKELRLRKGLGEPDSLVGEADKPGVVGNQVVR